MKSILILILSLPLMFIGSTLIVENKPNNVFEVKNYESYHRDMQLKNESDCSFRTSDTILIQRGGGLSCDLLSNCNNGASCSGPGVMLGPCSIDCDSGPEIECGFGGGPILL